MVSIARLQPGYQQNFYSRERGGVPAYPNLWKGLVGTWSPSLGNTGGTLRDVSGRGNHGTLTNMDPATAWVLSEGRYALDFDAADDYVQAALPTLFTNIAANSCSISFWIKGFLLGQATFKRILDIHFDSSNQIQFTGAGPGKDNWIQIGVNDAGTLRKDRGDIAGNSGWTHIVGTWNAATNIVQIYNDGVLGTGFTEGTQGAGSVQALTIGRRSNGTADTYIDNQIDDIFIWDYVLPLAIIKDIHTLGRGGIFQLAPRFVGMPVAAGVTADITGTATDTIDEADVTTGEKTIITTLTGDTWVPAAGA